jgi:hypothetical protein
MNNHLVSNVVSLQFRTPCTKFAVNEARADTWNLPPLRGAWLQTLIPFAFSTNAARGVLSRGVTCV